MTENCDWVEPPPLSVFSVQDQPVYACCYDHSEAPMTITQLEPTSSVPKSIAHFTREGTTEICGSRATLKLSRYENVLDHSRSQLDMVLAHDNYNDVDVMNLKSNGDVNVPGSLSVGGTAVALETDIPATTDVVNNTSVSATASSGSTAGVAVTNTTNGVNLAFTIPPGAAGADGADGTTPTISVGTTTTGSAGTNASVSASTSGTTTTFDFTIPKGDTGSGANVINGIHAQFNLHGGGNVVFDSSGYLKWDTRIIAIPVKEPEYGANGYISIDCPTSGTITYYNSSGTQTTKTCTSAGIPIGNWEALWYVVTPGQGNTSAQTRFVVNSYPSRSHTPDENWLLIASRNGDSHGYFIKYLPGQVNIPLGGGYTSAYGTLTNPTFSGTASVNKLSVSTTSGGITDNGYEWLECENDSFWGRFARTARTNGIACYNGIAINDGGGLVVGSWDSPNALGVGNGKFTGDLVVNNNITGDGQLYLTSGWFRTYGSQGWYNETHQGGWYMTDSTWMRTYNQKSIWAGSGNICCSGSMGAGTSSPGYKLDVRGTARAETFIADNEFKTQDAGVVKHGGVLAMDQFTWRRVVPQRWSGHITWTPLQNDRAALSMRVVMNSNAGNGSRDWRQQTDYYDSGQYLESRWNGGWLEFRKAGTNSGLGFQTHYYHVTMYGAFI